MVCSVAMDGERQIRSGLRDKAIVVTRNEDYDAGEFDLENRLFIDRAA
jgi:hypothetical protein